MLDNFILLNILTYITNPMDFINLLIAILGAENALLTFEYFKNTKQFQEFMWMYNCGVLARYIFPASNDNMYYYFMSFDEHNNPMLCYDSYDYLHDYHYTAIRDSLFQKICNTHISVYIHDDYCRDSNIDDDDQRFYAKIDQEYNNELISTLDIDLNIMKYIYYNLPKETQKIIDKYDDKFNMLYDKYKIIFKAAFYSHKKYNSSSDFDDKSLIKRIISNKKIVQYIKHHCRPVPFISKNECNSKEDYYSAKKNKNKIKYNKKQNYKKTYKHRSSPYVSTRKAKYAKRLECYV
jgi:hypothetical protein